jgi:hypothetical protein
MKSAFKQAVLLFHTLRYLKPAQVLGGCGIGLYAADAGKRNIWHRRLINRWIEENPVGKAMAGSLIRVRCVL